VKIAGQEVPKLLADALADCRQHFVAAAVFSLLINLLYLAPTIYMLQVYDRVVPTGGKTTLLFVTMALALALLTLSLLDMVRNRLLVRASQRIDALIVPRILRQMMATDSAAAGQAMRDFDSVRTAMATPAIAAIFDAPWTPVFLLVAFMLHFWIGILAIFASPPGDRCLGEPARHPEEYGNRNGGHGICSQFAAGRGDAWHHDQSAGNDRGDG